MAKVTMPQLGESVAEGTIGKWLKQPGDHVDKYEPLLEVITDKVNAEVPSPFEGVLKEILAEEGATVPNNAEIAVIETADDGASSRRRTACRGQGRTGHRAGCCEGHCEARRRRSGPGRHEGTSRFGRIRERLVRRGSRPPHRRPPARRRAHPPPRPNARLPPPRPPHRRPRAMPMRG